MNTVNQFHTRIYITINQYCLLKITLLILHEVYQFEDTSTYIENYSY